LEPSPPADPDDTERPPAPFDPPRSRDGEVDARAEVPGLGSYSADELQKLYEELLHDRNTWRRKALEYHGLIEGILRERDQWKEMWFKDSAGHQQAQGVLEVALTSGRQLFRRLLTELNALRKEKGLQPIQSLKSMDAEALPAGIAAATKATNAEIEKAAPPGIDGIAERDRIEKGNPNDPKEAANEQPA